MRHRWPLSSKGKIMRRTLALIFLFVDRVFMCHNFQKNVIELNLSGKCLSCLKFRFYVTGNRLRVEWELSDVKGWSDENFSGKDKKRILGKTSGDSFFLIVFVHFSCDAKPQQPPWDNNRRNNGTLKKERRQKKVLADNFQPIKHLIKTRRRSVTTSTCTT